MDNFEDNRNWANQISEKLEHLNEEEIIEYLIKLESNWKLPESFEEQFIMILKNLNISNLESVDMNYIEVEKEKIIWELSGVQTKFNKLIYDHDEYKIRWEKLLETFYYCEKALKSFYLLSRIKNDSYNYTINEDTSALFKFVPINYDKNTNFQNLLLYLLEDLKEMEYARYNDTLYKKIKSNNHDTCAWESEFKIKKYIMDKCRKNYKFDQWKNLTSGNNNIRYAVEYLTDCPEDELMTLEKDRHVFSFNNGIYLTKINKGTENKPIWSTLFVKYGEKSEYITSKTVASKYFDQKFNDYPELSDDDWFDILNDCPNFKKILDYQEFPKDVQMWLCRFMGRSVFELGELDCWQACAYLLGQAGSGKSTILCKILQRFYDEEDVGMISNNIEKQYGLKPNINKKLVLAPEMQGDCKLEQTDWQLIVEGGKNSFAEKFKNAENEYWKVPMFMAGNQLIKYKNPSEQVSRRTVVWNFWKKVIDTDTHLDKKLELEIPKIMKLCVTGYLNAVNKHGDKGIWKILPEYFHEKKDDMEQTTNALQHFLRSSKIILGSTKFIPEKVFKQSFNEHCRENNLCKEQWSTDYYSSTFSNNNIVVKKKTRRKYPDITGEFIYGTFFIGADIIDDSEEQFIEPE